MSMRVIGTIGLNGLPMKASIVREVVPAQFALLIDLNRIGTIANIAKH